MESSNSLRDLVERIYSWIPRRVEPQKYWMPDRSCRLCYECNAQFSWFNRRHHCRLCGKVFCGKCSLKTIPSVVEEGTPSEEGERLRVCNWCYENEHSAERHSTPPAEGVSPLTPSSSVHSNSGSSGSSSGLGAGVLPSPQHQVAVAGGPSNNYRSSRLWDEARDESPERVHALRSERGGSIDAMSDVEQCLSPYRFASRNANEEDHFERFQDEGESRLPGLQGQPDDYEGESGHDLPQETKDRDRKSDASGLSTQSSRMGHHPSSDDGSESSKRVEPSDWKGSSEAMEDSTDDTSIYEGEVTQTETPPLDFESNPFIWVPPLPGPDQDDEEVEGTNIIDGEDGDDDYEGTNIDDGDDEGVGWGVPPSPGSGSVSSVDIKTDRTASDEHRKAMQAQVKGHFRNLVAQLLRHDGIDVGKPGSLDSWLEIVDRVSWHAASLVKPDTSNGGGMDPGGYVKVKCVATGRPSDSVVVKGIVCRNKVANKRMTAEYKNPKLLLLGGALEYQRVSNQLSSLDALLEQEKDHLIMAVSKIEAFHPNVLLVEKAVSGVAQEILLKKDITLVLNMKRPLLDRIARCVGGQVVPSLDTLEKPKGVYCEHFHVQKIIEEHGSAGGGRQQQQQPFFLVFFEGCPKPLGCTVLLKGANGHFLKRVKAVVQLAVFSAYHLRLETSFLEDEGATLPELHCRSTVNGPFPKSHSASCKTISSAESSTAPVSRRGQQTRGGPTLSPVPSRQNSTGALTAFSNVDTAITTGQAVPVSASSSCVSSPSNSPESSPASGFESMISRSASIGGTSTTTYRQITNGMYPGGRSWQGVSGLSVSLKRCAQGGISDDYANTQDASSSARDENLAFELKTLDVNTISGSSISDSSDQIVTTTASMVSKGIIRERGDEYHIVPEEVYLRVLVQPSLQSDTQISKEDFPPSPSDRQSILVYLSKRCLSKGTVVQAPQLVRITYYGYGDKPLEKFLKDTLFDTSRPCESCDERGDGHVQCYTHRQGSLTISVKRMPETHLPLSGEKDGRIWMWHRCLKCPASGGVPPATPRVVMSDAACGLSFGKFLELSFSTHPAASRLAACGHSLHRDCLRFYGFGSMIACFRYAQITLRSVKLPPLRLDLKCSQQEDWILLEVEEITGLASHVFGEIVKRLHKFGEEISSAKGQYGSSEVLDAKRRMASFEAMLQSARDEFEEALAKARTPVRETGQAIADILELNWLRRDLLIRSVLWVWRLDSLKGEFPSKKRGTAPVDDSSVLSTAKDLSNANANTDLPEGLESEKESSTEDVSGDMSSTSMGLSGSTRSEQVSEDKNTKNHISSDHQLTSIASSDINQGGPSGGRTDLGDRMCSMSDTEKSPTCDEELLNNIDLRPARNSTLHAMSVSMNEKLIPGRMTSGTERNEDEAAGGQECEDFPGREVVSSSPSRSLEGNITAHRSLSEGRDPLLPDSLWERNGEPPEASDGDLPVGKSVEPTQGEQEPDGQQLEAEGLVRDSASQPVLENGVQQGDAPPQDKIANSDLQISVPTSPVKLDNSVDISEGWMGAPFANLLKSYSRTSSTTSTTSDGKVLLPGFPSMIPRTAQLIADGGARMLLSPGRGDAVVAVFDNEPTTIIAYALSTEEHYEHVTDLLVEKERDKEKVKEKDQERDLDNLTPEPALSHPLQPNDPAGEVDSSGRENSSSSAEPSLTRLGSELEIPVISKKSSQKTITFSDDAPQGKVKFQVTCYCAKQFHALRKKCCMGNMEYVRSLCRCKKWGAQGGKSNVFFAKTADERFVVKEVKKTELNSFLDFASHYFKYLFEALTAGNPTCLAKIFGVYEVKCTKGGKETKMDLLVMENLLYGRNITRLYDLKGSVRSRYNADTGKNQVLLDQNLVEAMPTNPIYIGSKAKWLLERAVWNDTNFLSLVLVMDYSLLVGIDEERQELVVGIIDFIRQYTWDKHLETWVKASGFLGGPKNAPPTVISPKQYKKRFRKAMATYFLMVPDKWIPDPQLAVTQLVNTVVEDKIKFVMKEEGDLPGDADSQRQNSSH